MATPKPKKIKIPVDSAIVGQCLSGGEFTITIPLATNSTIFANLHADSEFTLKEDAYVYGFYVGKKLKIAKGYPVHYCHEYPEKPTHLHPSLEGGAEYGWHLVKAKKLPESLTRLKCLALKVVVAGKNIVITAVRLD